MENFSQKSLIQFMRQVIDRLELNLEGLTVLTEGASGFYASTPIIALLTGAERVIALGRDSIYGSAQQIEEHLGSLIKTAGIPKNRFFFTTKRDPALFSSADIVTNLNFVRPITADIIAAMKPDSVISLMFEAWEFRSTDLDLDACHKRGIRVVATNEHFETSNVFGYTGWLGLKLLLEAQIEVFHSKIVIVSPDLFGVEILRVLIGETESVNLYPTTADIPDTILREADALIIADCVTNSMIIGPDSPMPVYRLQEICPHITVIPYVGWVDTKSLIAGGIRVYPKDNSAPRRMSRTLAYLGPRPIIDLHTMGLKCAELVLKPEIDSRFLGLYQLL